MAHRILYPMGTLQDTGLVGIIGGTYMKKIHLTKTGITSRLFQILRYMMQRMTTIHIMRVVDMNK